MIRMSIGAPELSAETVSVAPVAPPGNIRVGVLDDERDQASLLVEMLAAFGFTSRSFDSVPSVMQAVLDGELDVLLTDLNLGDLSGWQVARRVKALSPEVGVVLVTGWPVENSPELLRSEVDAVIQKPYRMSDVITAVERHARR